MAPPHRLMSMSAFIALLAVGGALAGANPEPRIPLRRFHGESRRVSRGGARGPGGRGGGGASEGWDPDVIDEDLPLPSAPQLRGLPRLELKDDLLRLSSQNGDGRHGTVVSDKSDMFLDQKFKSGYIHVGETLGEMFYWMFYARKESENNKKPLIVWLTGGPGCSSEMATLSENGPFWVEANGTLTYNPDSWSEAGSVLYIDQPLGTGFSTAMDPRNYVFDEKKIAKHMHQFFVSFLKENPEFVDRPFYITGESYAGHYIPAIAHHLLEQPIEGLNLVGIAIGNGWVDPYTQYPAYADYAYENGLISKEAYHRAQKGFEVCDASVKSGVWPVAMMQCNAVMAGLLGKLNPYDIRLACEVPPLCYNETSLTNFLNDPNVKAAIGAHGKWKSCDMLVHTLLLDEWVVDMRQKVEKILESKIRVLVYNGDKDFICNWRGGLDWVNIVEWRGRKRFAGMKLKPWQLNQKAVGEIKRLENFTFLRIYDAGHMVPMDQPFVARSMLQAFVDDTLGTELIA